MIELAPAAFGRLCVETEFESIDNATRYTQPPSGGCVLKRVRWSKRGEYIQPAAFGRLCVETDGNETRVAGVSQPPSGGCVLKLFFDKLIFKERIQPPSGGCVLKRLLDNFFIPPLISRLRAAVC